MSEQQPGAPIYHDPALQQPQPVTGQPPAYGAPQPAGYPVTTAPPPGAPPGYPGAPPPGAQPGYAAPPPGVQPGYAAPPPGTVLIQTNAHLRESPGQTICPHCQATVVTTIDQKVGLVTWIAAGGTCLIGCWLGCCLIPFCIPQLKDTEHTCPNCNGLIKTYSLMS